MQWPFPWRRERKSASRKSACAEARGVFIRFVRVLEHLRKDAFDARNGVSHAQRKETRS